MYARLLTTAALALGSALVVAPPAHATSTNWCSVTDGHLTITSTETVAESWVAVGTDGSQGGAAVVFVGSPSNPVCYTGAAQSPRLIDLTGITIVNQVGGPLVLEVGTPFEGANGLVPITVSQQTDFGSRVGLRVTSTGSSVAQNWQVVAGAVPQLSLDGDGVADLTLSDQPETNHTDKLSLITSYGDDVIDLAQPTLPATWPAVTEITTDDGADVITGGPERDQVEPGNGPDLVDLGPEAGPFLPAPGGSGDVVTVFGDFAPDTLLGDGYMGGRLNYLDASDVLLRPGADQPGDPAFSSGSAEEIDAGMGDRIGGFRAYTGGWGNDRLVAPAPDPEHPDPVAPAFDGGSGGSDTLDLGELPFGAVIAPFQGPQEPDQLAYPNQSMGAIERVDNIIGTAHDDNFDLSGDFLVVVPGLGNDTVSSDGTRTTLVADSGPDGNDSLTTADGTGSWDYGLRTAPLTVTLDDTADDGDAAAGETDNVRADSVATVILGSAADSLSGSAADDRIVGNGGADTLLGRGGNDVLEGGLGNDVLVGGSADDVLRGGLGDDVLNGSQGDDDEYGDGGSDTFRQGASVSENGADVLVGGDGSDTVSYLGRGAGVTISNDGATNDGEADEYDRIQRDVEKLIGTNYADTITGSTGADVLSGLGGNDTFRALASADGADVVIGGSGTDTMSYALRSARVSVVLDSLANDGALGEGDKIGTDVENLIGGAGADVLKGSSAANSITGGAGADKVYGLGGNDTFYTKDGVKDTLDGGSGTDRARADSTDAKVSVERSF